MNKRAKIATVVMLVIIIAILIISISVATATTKRNYWIYGDKWDFGSNILTFKYYSNYYRTIGNHGASVKNNQSGEYQQQVVGSLLTAKTKVGASWNVDGTARCW